MALIPVEPINIGWDEPDLEPSPDSLWRRAFELIKIGLLLLLWSFFTFVLVLWPINRPETLMVTILPNETLVRQLPGDAYDIKLRGPIDRRLMKFPKNLENVPHVSVRMEWRNLISHKVNRHTDTWNVYLTENIYTFQYAEATKIFVLGDTGWADLSSVITFHGNCKQPVALVMEIDPFPMVIEYGVVYAALLLLGLYILIIFEMTDPTFAAHLIATTGVATLAVSNDRPPLVTVISWIHFDTLMLMAGNMVILAIMSDTGVFGWLVLQAYRKSRGHPWLVVYILGLITAVLSSVLDNVMIVNLMVPIVVQLCEAINVRTSLVILMVVIYSNLGGALTPVGVPTNMIIATHIEVDFFDFSMHMLPGVLGSMLVGLPVTYLTMRTKLYRLVDRQMMQAMPSRFTRRVGWIRKRDPSDPWLRPAYDYFETVAYLRAQYGIRDKSLLVKSLIAIAVLLVCFVMQMMPFTPGCSYGWSAILGAFLLVILAKLEHITWVLCQIDWSALLYLAAICVLTTVLERLGLVQWMSQQAVAMIASVEAHHQTMVAILLVLWISGLMAALLGNVPVATLMLKVVLDLSQDEAIKVPLSPLIWALSYGACFGSNGSLFGVNTHVFGAVIARHYGYRLTPLNYFLYSCPVMIASLLVASAYLMIAHVVFTWHEDKNNRII